MQTADEDSRRGAYSGEDVQARTPPAGVPSGELTEEAKEVLEEIVSQAAEQCRHLHAWLTHASSWAAEGVYRCPEGPMLVTETELYTLPAANRYDDQPDFWTPNLGGETKVFSVEQTGHTETAAHLMRVAGAVEDALGGVQRELVQELGRAGFTAALARGAKNSGVLVVSGSGGAAVVVCAEGVVCAAPQ